MSNNEEKNHDEDQQENVESSFNTEEENTATSPEEKKAKEENNESAKLDFDNDEIPLLNNEIDWDSLEKNMSCKDEAAYNELEQLYNDTFNSIKEKSFESRRVLIHPFIRTLPASESDFKSLSILVRFITYLRWKFEIGNWKLGNWKLETEN